MADALRLRFGMPLSVPSGNTPAASSHTLSANNNAVAFIFRADNTEALTHGWIRYGVRTGTPPTYRLSLQGVSAATGFPDGTVKGGGSPVSVTFTPPADASIDGLGQWLAFANSYTPTLGELLALVFDYSSGTVDGSNNSSITTHWTNCAPLSGIGASFPQALRQTTGTWAGQAAIPAFCVRGSTRRYGFPYQAMYNTRSASTVGHRRALKFNLPTSFCSTYKLAGFRMVGSIAAATGKNPVAAVWDSTSSLQSLTLDSDVGGVVTSAYVTSEFVGVGTPATLNAGTDYYIGLQVADATNGGVLLNGVQLGEANDRLAFPLTTSDCLSSYDGSNWTDDTTVRPFVELIFDDITAPSGSSGGGYVIGG
jgi:hypothetical protein